MFFILNFPETCRDDNKCARRQKHVESKGTSKKNWCDRKWPKENCQKSCGGCTSDGDKKETSHGNSIQ